MNFFELGLSERDAKNCLHHRGEIVLVDIVLECHENGILTQSTIEAENPFLKSLGEEKVFPTYQCIELIAQSLGCYQKILQSRMTKDGIPKIGFLLSARNFEILKPYAKVGQKIFTQVELTTQDVNGFGVCEGKVYFDCVAEENLACHSSVSVLSPKEDIRDFLRRENA